MAKETHVHILMPTHNSQKTLYGAIKSITKQSYKTITILIYDDGSQDNTPELLEKFSYTHNNIYYIRNKSNQGISFARNKLIEMSRSLDRNASFLWLDSDDQFAHENSIKLVLENMAETKSEICLFSFEVEWENNSNYLRSNAKGLLQDKKKHEILLDAICKHPQKTIGTDTCPLIFTATSLGWTKCYIGQHKYNWPNINSNMLFEDFPPMALLFKAKKISALSPEIKIVRHLRRINSTTGSRKPSHFLHDFPKQISTLLKSIDITNILQVSAALDFSISKYEQYMSTLTELASSSPEFNYTVTKQFKQNFLFAVDSFTQNLSRYNSALRMHPTIEQIRKQ
jgi:glycosyltransferase involved in cell wall biosynthesis